MNTPPAFSIPGGGVFGGLGALDPDIAQREPPRTMVPVYGVYGSGAAPTPEQAAMAVLNKELGQVASALVLPLQNKTDPQTQAVAGQAAQVLGSIEAGYRAQLMNCGHAGAWARPDVRLKLQQWRIALAHVKSAADLMKPRPGMAGMGTYSWNPNNWGLTDAEVAARDAALAQQAILLAKADAAVSAANPGVLDAASKALQASIDAASKASNAVMYLGAAGVAVLVWWMFKDPERGVKATTGLAEGGARAAGAGIGTAAKMTLL